MQNAKCKHYIVRNDVVAETEGLCDGVVERRAREKAIRVDAHAILQLNVDARTPVIADRQRTDELTSRLSIL